MLCLTVELYVNYLLILTQWDVLYQNQFKLGYVTDICVYSSSLYADLATKKRKGE